MSGDSASIRKYYHSSRSLLISARSFLASHMLVEAMILCVMGWSLMWAVALSLVSIVPIWIAVVFFYAGLALIPFCQKNGTL